MANAADTGNAVDKVMSQVLQPAGLEERHINSALGSINLRDVDAADLYFQVSRQESWSLEDGKLKEGSFCNSFLERVSSRVSRGLLPRSASSG